MVWIYIIIVTVLSGYSYMGFRRSYECGSIYSQCAFLLFGIIAGMLAYGFYLIIIKHAQSYHIAAYYILTFLAIIFFGSIVWDEKLNNLQVLGILFITLGLTIWTF